MAFHCLGGSGPQQQLPCTTLKDTESPGVCCWEHSGSMVAVHDVLGVGPAGAGLSPYLLFSLLSQCWLRLCNNILASSPVLVQHLQDSAC